MTEFTPKNPDYLARAQSSFERQAVMQTLGIELNRVAAGSVEMEMPYREEWTQQHGFLHAGIVSTALDSACGYAAFTLMPADAAVLTIEFKINLLAPAAGERFLFRAAVTKPGRTITVADGQAFAVDEKGGEKMIASMTGTLMAVFGRDGIVG